MTSDYRSNINQTNHDLLHDENGNIQIREQDPEKSYQAMAEIVRNMTKELETLNQLLSQYSKQVLLQIARIHHFRGYSKYNKQELTDWISQQLMKPEHMKALIEQMELSEIALAEATIQDKGILIPEEFISRSLFLCTYGAFNETTHFFHFPKEVAEAFQSICTEEFKEELGDKQILRAYVQGMIYLYGVISLDELKKNFIHYEKRTLSDEELTKTIEFLSEKGEIIQKELLLMDSNLEEEDTYLYIQKEQEAYSRYLPHDFEELLSYGIHQTQLPGEEHQFFMNYLQKTMGFDKNTALEIFVELCDAIRMNEEDTGLLAVFEEYDYHIASPKMMEETLKQLWMLSNYIRRWELFGHTPVEIQAMTNKTSFAQPVQKIVPITKGKKIYPNDPCPCGSGKKYKNCCSRK